LNPKWATATVAMSPPKIWNLVQHLAGSRRSHDPLGIGGHAREVGDTSM
jgi:hypothetical protein